MKKEKITIIPLFLFLSFILLRTVKFLVFLNSINVQVSFLKAITLTIIGFLIYSIFLRNKLFAIFVYFIESFWISLNSIYFLYFDNYFHLLNFFFHLTTNFSNAKESMSFLSAVKAVSWLERLGIILIDLLPFILIIHKRNYKDIKELLQKKVSLGLFFLILFVVTFIEVINFAQGRSIYHFLSKSFSNGLSLDEERYVVKQYGTLFLNSLDIAYLINKNIIYREFSQYPIVKLSARNNKKNIIILQVESLDSSIVFTDYKGIPITPFLRSLASNSIFFPYVVSYHFAGYTSDAEFAVINSIHPLKDIPSMRYWDRFDNSLSKIFKSNNYSVWAFHGNHGKFFDRETVYKKMGFDEFFDIDKMKLVEKVWGAEDKDVLDFVYNFVITNTNKNFFVYVITMSSHGPFTIVQNYYTNELFSDIKDEIVRNYFNSINYVDSVLSNFVMKASKIPNTVIVIFGDHHSSVGNSEYYRRSVSYVYGKVIEIVPLFIIYSDIKKIIKKPVSQLDIAPTVINISGVKGNVRTMGEVILPSPKKDEIFYLGKFVKVEDIISNLNFK